MLVHFDKHHSSRMNSSDYRVTALLTEHLGFAPLTLVDEVINAVNKIMYNCTDALENFLIKRREAQLNTLRAQNGVGENEDDIDIDGMMSDQIAAAEKSGDVFPLAEIKHGTAELESLLVTHVDKYFDKFELYTLRNILTMPRDLVEDGWIRLKHHEHLGKATLAGESEESNSRIRTLVRNISMELQLRRILQLQLAKSKKIVSLLTLYKHSIEALILVHLSSELSPDTVRILKESLTPMGENIHYILSQLNELIEQVLRLNQTIVQSTAQEGMGLVQFRPTNRESYLREKTIKLLKILSETSSGLRPPAA